jgi:hypothetical protein
MLSHDLARALLARRNNDVRIEVLVDDDPKGEREIFASRTELRDDSESSYRVATGEVVSYDAEDDVIVIKAAFVAVGS